MQRVKLGLALSVSIMNFVSAGNCEDTKQVLLRCLLGLGWMAIAVMNLDIMIKENN